MKKITEQERSNCVSVYAPVDGNIYNRDSFEKFILTTFENYEFPVSLDYDLMLKKQYGNYLELPPENDRKGHNIEAYMNEL
ncbi:LicD family protein [Gallibacterium anatis]|nr:LicD family protein [Gallibacterium anatis]